MHIATYDMPVGTEDFVSWGTHQVHNETNAAKVAYSIKVLL